MSVTSTVALTSDQIRELAEYGIRAFDPKSPRRASKYSRKAYRDARQLFTKGNYDGALGQIVLAYSFRYSTRPRSRDEIIKELQQSMEREKRN